MRRTDKGTGPDCVARWQHALEHRVGMDARERSRYLSALREFCAKHQVEPAELIERWLSFPELTVRRQLPWRQAAARANPAVESFLIHNGKNIFGDLVCLPGRADDLRDQGHRFAG